MVETRGDELGLQILRAVQELGTRMERVEVQVNHLSTRMDRLGSEFIHFREEVRGDIRQWRAEPREDPRRLKVRLKVTATKVVQMASVLQGPTEFSVELEAHLSELHAG
jgi:hypothetical protein